MLKEREKANEASRIRRDEKSFKASSASYRDLNFLPEKRLAHLFFSTLSLSCLH